MGKSVGVLAVLRTSCAVGSNTVLDEALVLNVPLLHRCIDRNVVAFHGI